jgi:thiamine pyrophosphate-dependent acetolactate synthase large subunit-like protein
MGVEACQVTDCDGLETALDTGLSTPSPYLIEVVL